MHARILDGDKLRQTSDLQEIRTAIDGKQPVWVELENQGEDCDTLLADVLHLHPLTIEDIWATRSAPKLENYDSYLRDRRSRERVLRKHRRDPVLVSVQGLDRQARGRHPGGPRSPRRCVS